MSLPIWLQVMAWLAGGLLAWAIIGLAVALILAQIICRAERQAKAARRGAARSWPGPLPSLGLPAEPALARL